MVASYPGLIATLILKGKKPQSIELFGKEPAEIVIPYNKKQLDALLMLDEDGQIAIGNYCGQLLHHLPSHALLIQKFKKRGEFKYSSPHQILQHALFVINILNADSSGTTKCKAIGKVEGPPLRTMERS